MLILEFIAQVNVTDLWSRVQHSPHETFAVLKTGDNKKYVVMISNEGWYGNLALLVVVALL